MTQKTSTQIILQYKEAISADEIEQIQGLIEKDPELVALLEKLYVDIIQVPFNNIVTSMSPEQTKDTFLYFKAQREQLELLLNLNPE